MDRGAHNSLFRISLIIQTKRNYYTKTFAPITIKKRVARLVLELILLTTVLFCAVLCRRRRGCLSSQCQERRT